MKYPYLILLTLLCFACAEEDVYEPPTPVAMIDQSPVVDNYIITSEGSFPIAPSKFTFYNASENFTQATWDFGNGTTSNSSEFSGQEVTYAEAGEYTVKLTVKGDGGVDSVSTAITVNSYQDILVGEYNYEMSVNKKNGASVDNYASNRLEINKDGEGFSIKLYTDEGHDLLYITDWERDNSNDNMNFNIDSKVAVYGSPAYKGYDWITTSNNSKVDGQYVPLFNSLMLALEMDYPGEENDMTAFINAEKK